MLFYKSKKEFKEYNHLRKKYLRYAFCHAPENTLRFSVSGQVHICCRNRYFIAGKYPENTIEEIWNGKAIEDFRKKMKNYDLSYGCQFCEQHFKVNNFDFVKSLDYDAFQHNKKKTLRKLELELSNTCNLQCIMCSGELSSEISRCNNEPAPVCHITINLLRN
jgi:MoaA/NifB/PqqE/SkfB family radical SAM enzyme